MLKEIAKSIREYWKDTLLTPAMIMLEVIFECLLPFVAAKLIDEMTGESMEPIVRYGCVLLVLSMLSLWAGTFSARRSAVAGAGFAKNLRKDLFGKVQEFSFADIDYFSSASLVTRLTTDVTNVQQAFQMLIRMAVRTPITLIFSAVMSLSIQVELSLVFLVILPVLGVALFTIILKTIPIFQRIFRQYDEMNNSVQENVTGIRVVKSFVREGFEIKKFGEASNKVCVDFTRVEKVLALNNPIMMLCNYAAMLVVSYWGARMIILSGGTELTTGEMSTLIGYGIQILAAMMQLSMCFVMVSMASESTVRIVEVLRHEPSLADGTAAGEVSDGRIDFENVSFRYSANSARMALKNIELHLASGQTLGILGGTGSSKTTLIQLISRLYDASEGRVLVGGRDVKDYDLKTLRGAVAVVLQKNVLFSGSIRENLRWGKKDASEEEMVWACRLAQVDEFINQFPEGYDTHIEQGGSNVSGGQKQRLCIARALLTRPKILILDDSTSAVDMKTDALIRKALREELPDTTKIIIAQRVDSVKEADQIIVMDGGHIAERGTHKQLMAMGGIYAEVHESQLRGKGAVDE